MSGPEERASSFYRRGRLQDVRETPGKDYPNLASGTLPTVSL